MTLTSEDLKILKDLIGVTIDESLEKKLDEKLKNFPTKEEFFGKMDEVMKELKGVREETAVLPHQVKRNTKRIEKIEKKISLQVS